MFQKILIANRGEIAVRIARTAERMGIKTLSIYAQDDEDSLHRYRTDQSVGLKGHGPSAYLDQQQILALALENGVDAVHPGYGFLSENADFAECLERNGLRFIGPRAAQLRLFGDKALARERAQTLGVPVPQGTKADPTVAQVEALFAAGAQAVMIKAVSGGGGRGMRLAHHPDQIADLMREARDEALTATGDGTLYAEEFLPDARHIEVQILGDGIEVLDAGERECTLQRRNQKVIEIAPSPHLDPDLRGQIIAAAKRMAQGYEGLGTFEFLVPNAPEGDRRFAFIECNPRLQVEHTITEQITGLDLVEIQIALAAGARFADLALAAPVPSGMAMQLRLTMEGGAGRLEVFDLPGGPALRHDSAAYQGYAPSPRFDPLLGKIIVHERSGDYAKLLARARQALKESRIRGVQTNLGLLRALLVHPLIEADRIDTATLDRILPELSPVPDHDQPMLLAEPREHDKRRQIDIPEGWHAVTAPLSGSISGVDVTAGQQVLAARPVVTIEAMKMQNSLPAGVDGVLRQILVSEGDVVAEGDILALIEADAVQGGIGAQAAALDLELVPEALAEVLALRAQTLDAARPQAMAKLAARGKPSLRENLRQLCDPDSFVEIGQLATSTMGGKLDLATARMTSPADGLVAGYARINADRVGADAARCLVMGFDASVYGGTMGKIAKDKIERLIRLAKAGRRPILCLLEGGGARSGESEADIREGTNKMEVFRLFAEIKGQVPLIGIVCGNCFAGHAAFAGLCDVLIATPQASIGMAGPAMIEGAGLGLYPPEAVGPADLHFRSGVVDILVQTEAEAMAAARAYLGPFQGPRPAAQACDQRVLRHLVPAERTRAYDIRPILQALADEGAYTELRAAFGRAVLTVLMHVEGRPLGVLASNPRHLGGAIDAEAADKAAHFMQLCNAFGLPIVSLVDTPGFMVGPQAEQEALVRRVSRMFVAGAQLRVPLITCVLRKCYGLGGVAMNGGSQTSPLSIVAWPSGEFGAMNPEGSVAIAHKRELAAIACPAKRAATAKAYADEIYASGTAMNMARTMKFDEVIDPAETRSWITTNLETLDPAMSKPLAPVWLDTW